MAFPTTAVLDTFDRANGAIGSNWAAAFGDSAAAINANTAKGAAGGWYGMYWTPGTFGPDVECYYTLTAYDAGSSQQAMVLARLTTPTGSYTAYSARIAANQCQLAKIVGGTYTALATGPSGLTIAAGDKIGISCIGDQISLWYAPGGVWPSTPTLTVTDASISGSGYLGVDWNQSGANTNGMENFGGGVAAVAAPSNTVAPAITGTATTGSVLSCSTGTWTGSPTSYAYQWKRNGVTIAGATANTYTLQVADEGQAITCTVTATNAGGSTAATSNTVTPSAAPTAPANTVAPAITGTAQTGQTLTCSAGTWTGTPTITYAYQWKRNGTNIAGATASTYVLQVADEGQSVKCTVTATNSVSSVAADSNTVTPSAAPEVRTIMLRVGGAWAQKPIKARSGGAWV